MVIWFCVTGFIEDVSVGPAVAVRYGVRLDDDAHTPAAEPQFVAVRVLVVIDPVEKAPPLALSIENVFGCVFVASFQDSIWPSQFPVLLSI